MAGIKELIFFNEYGNGDVFESREFVKELYGYFQPEYCKYAHGKHPDILKDMEFIEPIPFDKSKFNSMVPFYNLGNTIVINTWIGRDGKFVLPGIGCTVEKLYEMYNEILTMMKIPYRLSKKPLDYIPEVNFLQYYIEPIDEFLFDPIQEDITNILICNGPVHSCQAENFDFTPVIDGLCKDNPKINFIVTSRTDLVHPNLFYTSDIIKSPTGFDLNEIGYLSQYCELIVGRNSGPHVFAQHKDNWNSPEKVCLSFTYQKVASHFVLSNSLPMRKDWSPETDIMGVYNKIQRVIDENTGWNRNVWTYWVH